MKFIGDYHNRPISQYIQTLLSLQSPVLLESLLLQTVCLVPGERKPLNFFQIHPSQKTDKQNTDTFYGPLSANTRKV